MKNSIILSFFTVLLLILFNSCQHETTPPVIDTAALNDTVYFYDEVLPIIQSNCALADCHGGNDDPDLTTYSSIKKLVKAGDPQNSRLYTTAIGNEMPPAPKALLNLEQVTSIYAWIRQGALENAEPCDTSLYTFNADILPIFKRNCLGCHNTGSANGEITNYNQIATKAATILGRITAQSGSIMPPSPANSLSGCKITKFTNWIKAGKLNN
ncbi:MAG: hypothetical protein NTZ33_12200 [Bacteroidetes bacterium]|nr:hypothetical protein [Bacteroidota bacterium]